MAYKNLGRIPVQDIIARAEVPGRLDADTLTRLKSGGSLTRAQAEALDDWLDNAPVALPDDSMEKHKAYLEQVNKDIERQNKRQADFRAGQNRLLEWVNNGLLEDTKENSQRIVEWLQANAKGYLSVSGVDAAVDVLGPKGTNVLTWRKPEPTKPAEPEPVELLPNGEARLPLGTIPLNRRSITQLRDLDARERAAKGRGGWHGAKF